VFATTHWSVVLAAGGGSSNDSREALERLCRTYWYPLYAYVRRRGHSPDAAADLTQSFFAHLLSGGFLQRAQRDKGRFRNYLLGAMNRFLKDEREREAAQKRGGGQVFLFIDALNAEERYGVEPLDPLDPEALFVRRWAMTILDGALQQLASEVLQDGKNDLFLRLEGFLVGDKAGGTYGEAAADLRMSEAAIKMAVARLRARCRELLREAIAQTVSTPAEAEEEYQALIAALRV
jgi:RNA polymerase sigma-70 factor (ECF subfamily)